MKKTRKIYLVTGGAGFIGSNLVKNLAEDGHKIIVIDNLTTGTLGNLKSVKNKIKFIKSTAGKILSIKGLKGIDGIFHLGIPSSSPLYKNNHLLTSEAVSDFINILDFAKRENCKIVFASSSSVYNGNKIPYTETQPVLIKDFYTEARYSMERLGRLYYDFFGVQSIGLRFFSVYGPGEESKKNLANLVSQFLWEMKKNKAPVLYGNGKQERDFIYVEDVIRGIKTAMNSKVNCDIFNLGTGKYHNLNELIKILNKVLNKNLPAVYVKNTVKNYIDRQMADTTKAGKILGFRAKTSLEQGIKKLSELN
ncbi:MAG: NAD-dependent epimerase/dehydratase family protein [Candidatus Nealsonbacteria bacterium]|nr:NAD-dependent epimerase/dehydratase family protein [Candidatus Nealsonbacteria bacterium]